MPPPPPDGDGFAHGMAAILGGLLLVASLGVTLPSVRGFDDPLGFGRHQRLALRGAGMLVVGFVAGAASGFLGRLSEGFVLLVTSAVLAPWSRARRSAWRLGEVLVRSLRRAFVGRAP